MCLLQGGNIDKISKVAPESDDEINPEINIVATGRTKNQNREGTISKPRAKRGSLPDMSPSGANRTPSLDNQKAQKALGRKLSQSPSVVNIQNGGHLNSDDGGEDDQQPMKPTINYEQQQEGANPDEMPLLASKHRHVGGKKGSVNVVSDNRLLNENESQNSNSFGQLPRADLAGKAGLREHRGSAAPRVINRVRGEKVMQVY